MCCAADLRHHWDNIQCNTSDAVTYVMGLRHRLCSLQFAASDVLVAAALLAGLVLAALLLRKALQRQVGLLLLCPTTPSRHAPALLKQQSH